MLKKVTFILFSLAFFAALNFAQQTPKVGIINPPKAFENSSEGKKAAGQLREKSQKIQGDLARKDDQIRGLETKYNTQKLTLTVDALEQLVADLDKARTERKRMEEDATREFEQLQARLFTKIRDEMLPIIEAVAKEKGFDMVLDASTGVVVFAQPAVDITDEVTKRYNAKKPEK